MKLLPLLLLASGANLLAQSLTITHANVIDVATGAVQPDSTVVITGNRITRVSRSAKTNPTGPGQVIDAHAQYLIPGLWDMHTHVYFDRTANAGTDLILPLLLTNGVTGIRDMGSTLNEVLQARTDIAAHRLLGPRMVVSGPMLDGPKSPYKAAIAIATPEDGIKAVDRLQQRGVDFIKVQSYVPRDAYFTSPKKPGGSACRWTGTSRTGFARRKPSTPGSARLST